jgi:hypothetical protein
MAVRPIVKGHLPKAIEEVKEVVSSCDFEDDVVFDTQDVRLIHDEGLYIGEFIDFKRLKPANTKVGDVNRIEGYFKLDDGSVISQSILLLPYPNQLFYKLVVSITGTTDSVRLKDLIGEKVMVEIKHNEKDGAVFANVVDIFPVEDNDYDEYSELEENDLDSYDEIDC